MNRRMLGKNGPMLSEIGFGAWAIGGSWGYGWGPVDDSESIRAIQRAVDLGINWIDTAAVYGLGHSEEVVGRAVKGRREKVFIATKCGLVWDRRGVVRNNLKSESIRRECEASLRRLQTDYIDLYQIHWPDPSTPVEDAWETLVRLKEAGKARYIGVSNFDVDLLKRCMMISHVQSLQPPYSMIMRKVEKEILPFCRENGIGVVVYSPLQSGLLTGKFDIKRLAPDDWRRKSPMFREPFLSKALGFVERIRPVSEKYGKSMLQFAISWALMHPSVTSAIVGARNVEQIEEIAGGSGITISEDDMEFIDQIYRETFKSPALIPDPY